MTARTRTTPTRSATTPPPAPTSNGLDLGALANGAHTVAALPPRANGNRPSASSALSDLVARSHTDGTPIALPPISTDEKTLRSLQGAIRRAASHAGLGVTIRHEQTTAGTVVTFQGRSRRT